MTLKKFADLKEQSLDNLRTIKDWIRFGISQSYAHQLYYGHGSDNPSDEIIALVLRTLELPLDLESLFLTTNLLPLEKEALFEKLRQRIDERVPVSYILNEAIFCNHSFYIDNRVLIPRSPVAELIDEQFSPWIEPDKILSLCDLCTGSGCIGIAATLNLPSLMKTTLVDISQDALDVAQLNINRFGVEDFVETIHSDLFENVPPESQFDIIISNPPYVPTASMEKLPQEYRHEPDFALDGGQDGLHLVDKILADAHNYMSKSGILIVEVGEAQEFLEEKYPDVPFTWLQFLNGGEGVFLLTAQELIDHHDEFAKHANSNT